MTKIKTLCLFFIFLYSGVYGQSNLSSLLGSAKMYPVKTNGKWGYIDNQGKLIIEAKFDKCYPFYEGLALIERGEDIWFIDEAGNKAFDTPFSMSRIISEGMIRILLDGKVGYINKKGEVIVEPVYKQGGDFSESLAWVRLESTNKVGFIDKKGDMKIIPVFEFAGDFHDGFAPVRLDGSWGYIDKSGKLFKNLTFTLAQDFSEGIAPLWKYGPDLIYIDKKGEEQFRHRIYEPNNLPRGSWSVPSWGMHLGRIKAQNTNGLIGYLNDKGETEIDFQFSDGGEFYDNLARVKSGTKWGYINKRGKMNIQAQFDYAGDFVNGIAPVYQGGSQDDFESGKDNVKLGYINPKGELIWPYNN